MDLNHRIAGLQAAALAIWLYHRKVVVPAGVEPATVSLKGSGSAN